MKKSTPNAPIASYCLTNRRAVIKPKDVMDTLWQVGWVNFYHTGINATDISARSLQAWGAMAVVFGKINMNTIHLTGWWHSDAMMHYLHGQAHPIVRGFAVMMYNDGAYIF
jgi:hypothetical protein